MKAQTSRANQIAGVLMGMAVASCGAATNRGYPGVPVAALQGQLVNASAVTLDKPVLLAMAWYPAWATVSPSGPANAIVTQSNITFHGEFPLNFTFSLYDAPPPEALADLSVNGGSGRVAWGVLIAYEDLNGNGSLDLIPDGGTPIDTIVGLSVDDPSRPPAFRSYYVVYLDGTVAAGDYLDVFALQQGYNLIAVHNDYGVERLSIDSPMAVQLTATPALNLYACPQAAEGANFFQSGCGIDPYQGKYQASGIITAGLQTALDAQDSLFFVYDGAGNLSTATIMLDSNVAQYDPSVAAYYTVGAASGPHHVAISVPGFPLEEISVRVPGDISIASPSTPSFATGSQISVAWTATSDVEEYDIILVSTENGKWLFHALTTSTSVTTPPINFVGSADLVVKAIGKMTVGAGGSFVTPASKQRTTLTFLPAP